MALTADRYRGDVPSTYEATRRDKPEWPLEQSAVAELVTEGPVLDAPIGTGRYVEIYKAKGLQHVGLDISPEMIAEARSKHPDLDAREGTIFDLPFGHGEFATAVCSRLLNWLEPEDMAKAVAELRRVAGTLVISIRTGIEGLAGNYTHDIGKFYAAIDGLHITERKLIRTVPSGDFEMFKLRAPVIGDVYRQFNKPGSARRISRRWTRQLGLEFVEWEKASVRAEYWSFKRIKKLILNLAALPTVDGLKNEILTDEPPRSFDGPLVIRRYKGREVLLDGRRRANAWMRKPGVHPVLVVEYPPTC